MRFVALCSLFVACGGPSFNWPEFRLSTQSTADQYIGVNALVLEANDTLIYEVRGDELVATMTRYRRTKVFTPAGASAGQVKIPFSAKMKLVSYDAQMRCPDGKVERLVRARLDEIVIRRPFGDEGVKEIGEVTVPLRDARPDCVVESFAKYNIPDALLLEPILLRDRLPVERADVLIITPQGADFDLRYLEGGVSKPESPMPAKAPSKSFVAYRFVKTNLPPLIPEELGPHVARTGPAVWPVFRGMKNGKGPKQERWEDVASWLAKKAQISLVTGGKTPEASELLQTFASEAAALEVKESELHFGDRPFGKSNDRIDAGLKLYEAMGRRGIKVGLGLVSRETAGIILPEVPSPAAFDAVVVAVPLAGKIVYLDPACATCPLEQVSQPLEGAPVVAITDVGSRVETLPVREAKENAFSITLSTKLGLKGDVTGSGQAVLSGAPAAMARAAYNKKDSIRFGEELGFTKGLVISNMQAPDAGTAASVTFDVGFEVSTSCAEEGPARMRCSLPLFVEKLMPTIWRESRTQDLIMPHVFQHQLIVTYQIPAKARVQPPQPMQVKTKFGDYVLSFVYENGQLAVSRRFSFTQRRVPVDEYDELYGFLSQARRFDAVGPLIEYFAEEPPPVAQPEPEPEPKKKGKKKK